MVARARPAASSARPRGRPRLISDEQLLAVAREVFLERGIQATTGEVAKRAGVSEGTIFHRFGSKDALFRAAMRVDPSAMPNIVAELAERVTGDLASRLRGFAQGMLEIGRVAVPVLMMSWSNPTGEYRLEKILDRADGYRNVLRLVCTFFERELDNRKDSRVNAEILARIFMGSLHHYCMAHLLGVVSPSQTEDARFIDGLVEVLMNTVERESKLASPRRPDPAGRPKTERRRRD